MQLLSLFLSVSGQCEPVCVQGCVNGTCVSPGVCQCHFGFVGENCSSQCRCNKHSNCKGVTQLDMCLKCHNHTKVLQIYSQIYIDPVYNISNQSDQSVNHFSLSLRVITVRSVSRCM